MLQCETNTPAMARLIKQAWRAQKLMRGAVLLDFEHGRWWVTPIVTGAQWSVNDALVSAQSNVGTVELRTFAFGQVTQGEEA